MRWPDRAASLVRALAARSSCLSLAQAFSIGFKSGEYGGRQSNWAPAASILSRTPVTLCELGSGAVCREMIQPEALSVESKIPMAEHPQRWIKVNAPIDEGVADIVETLNRVEGLETLQSCQGYPGEQDGYVYFSFGNWKDYAVLYSERLGQY